MITHMGIFDGLGLGSAKRLFDEAQLGIKSPWTDAGNLSSIVYAEALGEDVLENMPLTRAEAIAIPAVSKARNLLVATIAKWPLVSLRFDRAAGTDTDTTPQHPWLYSTSTVVPPYSRMVWTVDDGIFHGCSLWLVERSGEASSSGRRPIVAAEWVPFDWWTIADGRFVLYEDGDHTQARELNRDEFLFFDFPFEGLLNVGSRTLRGARDQERSWVGRAKNPVPVINLRRTEDYDQTPEELQEMVDDWAAARTSVNGAIGSTPPGVVLETFGELQTDLMIEGRNAVRTDVGSFLNVRVAMLDGTVGVDSLTYTTKDGERNSFFEMDVPFWTDPIEARLSMDDVVERGQRIRFQKYESNPVPTGPEVED